MLKIVEAAHQDLWWLAAVVDEQAKREIKELLMQYDRTLLVADPRRCEPKKYAAFAVIICRAMYMLVATACCVLT